MIGPNTRDNILAAALSVFTERGYEAATIQEIRSRAGVSNGSLFHFFPTKGDIARALFTSGINSYQQGLIEVLAQYKNNAEEGIRAITRYHLRWVEKHRELALLVFDRGQVDWEPAYEAMVQTAKDSLREKIGQWALRHIESGSLRPVAPDVLFACLIGPAQMMCRPWLAGKRKPLPSQYAPALEEAVWMALGQPRNLYEVPEMYPALEDAAWIARSWIQ